MDDHLAPESSEPTPVPAVLPVASNTPEHHEVMGQKLTQAIQVGKREVPEVPQPLVCKPAQLESWRVFKIMAEFVSGFELIGKYGLAASFFGTARKSFEPALYEAATALAGKLAQAGYAIITGGSDGIMEAANKGAFEAGGASVGLNINLGTKQGLNKFLTDTISFDHFFVRKVMLAFSSDVYIFFPGGFGTLDEFTEIITLVQTKKIRPIPIILFGSEYWNPLLEFFKSTLLNEHHAIDEADLSLYYLTDSVDDAMAYIVKNVTSC
ncbi:MAG: Cytokinin riboside 5-monophosphate phosphoribohydrolase [Parcubacteria group bacterium]|nr:Cytokinin riboside 5-monophosphate phosphoribohydrolase [Parcubacteria group bacterium]